MAHHDPFRKRDQATDDQPAPELLAHIATLGLNAADEYVEWCARHGFSRRLNKHWRARLKERAFHTEAISLARLSQKKHEARKPDKIIEAIFTGDLDADSVTQPHLKEICRACDAVASCQRTKHALHALLLHVGSSGKLLNARPVMPEYGRLPGNTFIGGLLALARFSSDWLRPLAEWKPKTHNIRRQFSSLARHLLAQWPAPAFMDSAWFKGDGEDALRQQNWFVHVGSGQNIRTADLPLAYTKRMSHHFMQPANLDNHGAPHDKGPLWRRTSHEKLRRHVCPFVRQGNQFDLDAPSGNRCRPSEVADD